MAAMPGMLPLTLEAAPRNGVEVTVLVGMPVLVKMPVPTGMLDGVAELGFG